MSRGYVSLRCFVTALVTFAIVGLTGCAVDGDVTPVGAVESAVPTVAPRPGVSEPWVVDFEADFEGLADSPDVSGSPGLPTALFPEDGSQWTQLQLSHPATNHVELRQHDRDGQLGTVLACSASGQADGEASKADLGRQGLAYGIGSQVRITADFYLDPGNDTVMRDNTLIDLEDTNDLFVDGVSPGAGLRLRVDSAGRLTLDRGEIPGREQPDASAVPRLTTLRSDYVPPVRQWFTVEMTLQLGVGATTSEETIDPAMRDEPAWVQVTVSSPDLSQTVLAMAGTNMLDPTAIRQIFDELDPNTQVRMPAHLDFDSLQVCATNNRSGDDVVVMLDNLIVESRSAS